MDFIHASIEPFLGDVETIAENSENENSVSLPISLVYYIINYYE